jgi:predicted dehydrogenase
MATASAVVLPAIAPGQILGQRAPSKLINVLQIGCGRIAREMDLPGLLKHDIARVTAVCDVDAHRLRDGKEFVENFYRKKHAGRATPSVRAYFSHEEALKSQDIDAVAISTPDHWHAELIVAAALADKDVYVQKPLTMTLQEGRLVSNLLRARKTAFQIGSQQRSDSPWPQFRKACELVRGGRVGRLGTVEIGLPTDPAGEVEPDMPIPVNLDYDRWLGCTPAAPYTEKRVHPQKDYSRPGWLRIESYCLGMITGWGSHHVDIAHWGMDVEESGPFEIDGRGEFPSSGLWNVHGSYHIEAKYRNGVTMIIDDKFPNGVRFIGSEGWIFCSRGGGENRAGLEGKPLVASNPKLLEGAAGVELRSSRDHHGDWLNSITTRSRAATSPEQAHRSTSACILGWIAMRLGRKLQWDANSEQFVGDAEANTMLERAERAPYGVRKALPADRQVR